MSGCVRQVLSTRNACDQLLEATLVDDAAQAVVVLALRRAGEDRGEKLPFLTSRKKSIAAPAIRRARNRLEQRGKLGEIRELLQNPAVAFGERVQRRAAPRSSK